MRQTHSPWGGRRPPHVQWCKRRANQALGRRRLPKAGSGKSMQPDTTPKARVSSPVLRRTRARLTSAKGWPKAPPSPMELVPAPRGAAHAQGQRGLNVRIGTRQRRGPNIQSGTYSTLNVALYKRKGQGQNVRIGTCQNGNQLKLYRHTLHSNAIATAIMKKQTLKTREQASYHASYHRPETSQAQTVERP